MIKVLMVAKFFFFFNFQKRLKFGLESVQPRNRIGWIGSWVESVILALELGAEPVLGRLANSSFAEPET